VQPATARTSTLDGEATGARSREAGHRRFPGGPLEAPRTTNPIESTVATVKLRSRVTKGAGSRAAGLTMTFKLLRAPETSWRRIDGQALIPLVRAGVRFIDGKQPESDNEEIKIEESKEAGKSAA
jgi:hypothetical protein